VADIKGLISAFFL